MQHQRPQGREVLPAIEEHETELGGYRFRFRLHPIEGNDPMYEAVVTVERLASGEYKHVEHRVYRSCYGDQLINHFTGAIERYAEARAERDVNQLLGESDDE